MEPTTKVILKRGREKSLQRRHPWVFSGAIERLEGTPVSGGTVEVLSSTGTFLASAAYSEASQIRLRAWSFDAAEKIDAAFFHRRLERAIEGRRKLGLLSPDTACRLVFSEADYLPGLIVDRYGPFLACQFLSAGAERWRAEIVEGLVAIVQPRGIYERSESTTRRKEGLPSRQGVLFGETPPPLLPFTSAGATLLVDIVHGQKTGTYLDQQHNREQLARHAAGARVLDAFAYSGGFSIACLLRGAEAAVLVDSSSEASRLAQESAARNGVLGRCEWRQADVFTDLRSRREAGELFDIVILDPPKFVRSAAQLGAGTRGYKDINWLGAQLVRPGGLLATFSCSAHVDVLLHQKIVAGALLDADRDAQIVEWFCQPPDHPVAMDFPESAYLKGLLLRLW